MFSVNTKEVDAVRHSPAHRAVGPWSWSPKTFRSFDTSHLVAWRTSGDISGAQAAVARPRVTRCFTQTSLQVHLRQTFPSQTVRQRSRPTPTRWECVKEKGKKSSVVTAVTATSRALCRINIVLVKNCFVNSHYEPKKLQTRITPIFKANLTIAMILEIAH